jgi:hypothetical protein
VIQKNKEDTTIKRKSKNQKREPGTEQWVRTKAGKVKLT